jgi:translation elongation factor EF-G
VSNLIPTLRVAVIGENSSLLIQELGVSESSLESAHVAIFIVSAASGIVTADLEKWRTARELYIPSIVAISDLESSDIDFEDMTAIASKMLDPVVTPFLVLHSDEGSPAALINLETFQIVDYSTGVVSFHEADTEHIELTKEFREEYVEALEDAGEDSFEAALLFPALPWIAGSGMGITQIQQYLNLVPVLSYGVSSFLK